MKRIAAFVFFMSMLAVPGHAQDDLLSSCASLQPVAPGDQAVPAQVTEQFQFLCGQVVNTLTSVQPSVGIAFSGGSHTLGTATTIGRRLGVFPRVAVGARLNGAWADAPDLLDGFEPTFGDDDRLSPMGTVGLPVGSLQGDVTIGLFNGLSFGPMVGGLGAIDLLGSVSYLPAIDPIGLTDDIINVGIGARVGILQQGLLMPGISVSGMYRTMLNDVTFGSMEGGDPAQFSTDLSTLSLRAGISKGLLMFDVSAGAGYDRYSSDVAFDFRLTCPEAQCGEEYVLTTENGVSGPLTTAAWNVHGNVGFSLLLLNIVAEAGYQKAMDVLDAAALRDAGLGDPAGQEATAGAVDAGRFFGSIGFRLTI